MEYNSHHVQTFLGSDAQMTTVTEELAERVDLLRVMDTLYAGSSFGVCNSKIID